MAGAELRLETVSMNKGAIMHGNMGFSQAFLETQLDAPIRDAFSLAKPDEETGHSILPRESSSNRPQPKSCVPSPSSVNLFDQRRFCYSE
jgi:hypothetical protein